MTGAWAFALLQQSKQFAQRSPGDCCAQQAAVVRSQVGGLNRKAQAHEGAIGHDDMAGMVGRMADRQDREAPTVEGVSGVGHLDLFEIGRLWVLEGGIMLRSRSTLWIMLTCGNCSGEGYVTGSCYD
jgi:hypothetical protein